MGSIYMTAFRDFTGGYNDTSSFDSLKDNELMAAENIVVSKSGAYPRRGCVALNKTSYASNMTQIIEWPLSDGNYKHLVMKGKKLCLMASTEGTLTEKIELNSTMISYVVYKDRLFFVDGNEYYVYGDYGLTSQSGSVDIKTGDIVKNLKSTGGEKNHFYKALGNHGSTDLGTEDYSVSSKWADVTDGIIPDDIRAVVADADVEGVDLTNIKKCTILEFHQPSLRIFASGNPDNGAAVYFSEPDNPFAFKGSSELYPTSALGPVTGLQPFMSTLMASYKTGWRVWSGIEVGLDAAWKPVPIPAGCVNHWAKTLTPDSLTFWGNDGLYTVYPSILIEETAMLVGNTRYQRLDEDKVEKAVKSSTSNDTIRVTYYDGDVYFAYSDVDTTGTHYNNKVLLMNWAKKSFVLNTGWQVNDWVKAKGTELWFATKNYLLKADTGLNDWDVEKGKAKPIHCVFEPKALSLGNFAQAFYMKFLKTLYISGKEIIDVELKSEINVTVKSDFWELEGEADFIRSLIWGRDWGKKYGHCDNNIQALDVNKKGFRHRIRIESETADNDWHVYSLGCEYEVLDGSQAERIESGDLSHIVD